MTSVDEITKNLNIDEEYVVEDVTNALKSQYEHHITDSIRSYHKKRILAPIIYLVAIILFCIFTSTVSLIFPSNIDETTKLSTCLKENKDYVNVHLKNLYFTGYTKSWLGKTTGYYYYTMMGDDCVIVLISGNKCQQGLPLIEETTLRCQIKPNTNIEQDLLAKLAKDLKWSSAGINSMISPYMLSQPDASNLWSVFLILAIVLSCLFSVVRFLHGLICIIWPALAPAVRRLKAFGDPKKQLQEAELELSTLPQLATDDMFITEHYFIETSNYGIAIVPISEMLWIYKYSTLHKFMWHTFSISYTLHITATKREYWHCPKNTQTNIDGIIDYLSEANHDILVGFSEENRQQVERLQGEFVIFRKFWNFLSKRV